MVPSQRVLTTGRKSAACGENSKVAPELTCRSTWLCRTIGPALYQWPAGNITRPPPEPDAAAMAARIAGRSSWPSSGTAPKSVMSNRLVEMSGSRICDAISSAMDQGAASTASVPMLSETTGEHAGMQNSADAARSPVQTLDNIRGLLNHTMLMSALTQYKTPLSSGCSRKRA